jgi:hypothetical protein
MLITVSENNVPVLQKFVGPKEVFWSLIQFSRDIIFLRSQRTPKSAHTKSMCVIAEIDLKFVWWTRLCRYDCYSNLERTEFWKAWMDNIQMEQPLWARCGWPWFRIVSSRVPHV